MVQDNLYTVPTRLCTENEGDAVDITESVLPLKKKGLHWCLSPACPV